MFQQAEHTKIYERKTLGSWPRNLLLLEYHEGSRITCSRSLPASASWKACFSNTCFVEHVSQGQLPQRIQLWLFYQAKFQADKNWNSKFVLLLQISTVSLYYDTKIVSLRSSIYLDFSRLLLLNLLSA